MIEGLLERESELARLDQAAERVCSGDGRAVVIEGPAGIGKTALLRATTDLMRGRGAVVLTAGGGELEGDLPFGVVRQLFEAPLRRMSAVRRNELLAGAAGLARPAVMPERAVSSGGIDAEGVLHGLYWLVSSFSMKAPLMLAIDDLGWADAASLRFVLYLLRRLEGLATLVVACVRLGEPPAAGALLAQVLAVPEIECVWPKPLSELAVGGIVASELGRAPEARFAAACRQLTGGTPFLVHELAAALREQEIEPSAESVHGLGKLVPRAVGQATMLRLARMVPAASALARAVAVLGADAELPRTARLAGIDQHSALEALDALDAARILEAGAPLGFVHPIVRAAVYNELAPGVRARAHARAAEVLAADGVADDVVASHLLATEPSGRVEVIQRLRAAATAAQARGAPDSALVYLRRALEEGPGRALRAQLLFELGVAEKMVRDPACAQHLEEARRLFAAPVARARAALELADVLAFTGRWEPAFAAIDDGIADAEGVDPTLAMRLETSRVLGSLFDARTADVVDRRLPLLRTAAGDGMASREMLLALAAVEAVRGGRPEAVVELIQRGLDGGRFLEEQPGAWMLAQSFAALVFVDALDQAEELLDAMEVAARTVGSVFTFVTAASGRVWVHRRRGALRGLGEELRAAVAFGQEHDIAAGVPVALWFGVDALVECDGFDDLAELATSLQLPPPLRQRLTGAELAEVRGRVLLARGERQRGIKELRSCGEILSALHAQPAVSCWRSMLALALAPDDSSAARDLVESELADARRVGLPRSIGIALRALGMVERGPAGIECLREAERVLRDSPARLEHARALVELGAALRRANQRGAARDPLRTGLDLAHRCGATRLAERSRTELVAAGARPKQMTITGSESLTPSEHRVATMAAEGMTNTEIAQALFVSAKTVENQLGRVYKKLDIAGRTHLQHKLQS